jgi:hypothetical protein
VVGLASITPEVSRTPKQVAEEYLVMSDNGTLLTQEGWNRANALFLKPAPMPSGVPIAILSRGNQLDEFTRGSRAEVSEFGVYQLGIVDPVLLTYTPPKNPKADWSIIVYKLVLAPKVADGRVREWKLEDGQQSLIATPQGALVYVTMVRDKTKNPQIRRNAEKTLAILRRLAADYDPNHRRR